MPRSRPPTAAWPSASIPTPVAITSDSCTSRRRTRCCPTRSLRREWDAKHAPGPLRADASGPARAVRDGAASTTGRESAPALRQPRRATRSRTGRRPAAPSAQPSRIHVVGIRGPVVGGGRQREPTPAGAQAPRPRRLRARLLPHPRRLARHPQRPMAPPPEAPNAFDVYNRSSGAAWSMAARAYFRRGDQELPRRGQFHYEGTQVVTGARARTAADAEARRRAPRHAQPARAAGSRATAISTGICGVAARSGQPRPPTASIPDSLTRRPAYRAMRGASTRCARRGAAGPVPRPGRRLASGCSIRARWPGCRSQSSSASAATAVTGCADASARLPALLRDRAGASHCARSRAAGGAAKGRLRGRLATVGALFCRPWVSWPSWRCSASTCRCRTR